MTMGSRELLSCYLKALKHIRNKNVKKITLNILEISIQTIQKYKLFLLDLFNLVQKLVAEFLLLALITIKNNRPGTRQFQGKKEK